MSSLLDNCKAVFQAADLYSVLEISKSATQSVVKKAYYKLSLKVHPDRVRKTEKEEATKKFQILGKVYSILADEEKRKIYDETGEIDDESVSQEGDWDQYWRLLFKKISVKDIDDFERNYKNSNEELKDLKQAYIDGEGDFDFILENVLCCTVADEDRFTEVINNWILNEEVESFTKFKKQTTTKKKKSRKLKADKEAEEASILKKELGMDNTEESLKQLILGKAQKREAQMDSFFDSLTAKYGGNSGKKSKKAKK